MSTNTLNFGLFKPELTDPADITKMNPNWDTIDAELKNLSEQSGIIISPDEPETGDVWIDTDEEGGGGGAVSSVNGQVGDVTLSPEDIDAAPSEHTHNEYAPSSHNHTASEITAGTFAGQVVANNSGQSSSTYLLRNQKLSATEETPTVNGAICWVYK